MNDDVTKCVCHLVGLLLVDGEFVTGTKQQQQQ